jgi:hypothetical protein
MYVWVFVQGQAHEGGYVQGIYETHGSAMDAMREKSLDLTKTWEEVYPSGWADPDDAPVWSGDYFSVCCDYLSVERRFVIP